MRALPLACSIAFAMLAPAAAQVQPVSVSPVTEVTNASRAQVLESFAALLRNNFVLPEAGAAYAVRLQQHVRDNSYRDAPDVAFAEAVTAELQAIHPDAHLRLFAPEPSDARTRMPGTHGGNAHAPLKPIGASGWLDDGIAYISFNAFFGQSETLAELKAFLDTHASANVLVLDVRQHHGGGLDEMDVLFPYLFAHATPLLRLDTRVAVEAVDGPSFEEGPTMRRVVGPAGIIRREHVAVPGPETSLRAARVYVLTSGNTVSAGEHLALALKRTHRATVIGETTHGAGNFGDFYPLPGGFKAFITVGRTFDPDTNRGWEGIGIDPDVAVPAQDALREALKREGRDPKMAAKFDDPTASGRDAQAGHAR